ncbi:MAG TPA: nitrous oxide reductase [Fibrobacteres bacterium]|nr:nitrous oxide reductase [Fibrobacterota bacterium]
MIAVLMGCSSGPVPLQYGTDSCHFCQMKLAQKSFGAERITAKGKVYKFDSIECLLESLRQEGREGDRIYVVDFSRPGTLGPAESAIYLRAKGLQSPMGAGLAAFAGMDSAKACQARIGGEFVSFLDLLKS